MVKKLPPKVLVSIPDNTFSTSVCNIIERYWFNTIKSNKYEDVVKLIVAHKPHIVVMSDLFDSDSILKLIANAGRLSDLPLPFLIIVSENTQHDFNSDLVSVIKKPFTPFEMMNEIKSLLRKSKPVLQTRILNYQDLTMNLATYRVSRGTKIIHLGPTEFKILNLLMSEPEEIFSRTSIIEHVWGKEHQIDARTVDVHINRIRSLLKKPEDKNHIIRTVRSEGYSMQKPE